MDIVGSASPKKGMVPAIEKHLKLFVDGGLDLKNQHRFFSGIIRLIRKQPW